jgi:hypothetical protein
MIQVVGLSHGNRSHRPGPPRRRSYYVTVTDLAHWQRPQAQASSRNRCRRRAAAGGGPVGHWLPGSLRPGRRGCPRAGPSGTVRARLSHCGTVRRRSRVTVSLNRRAGCHRDGLGRSRSLMILLAARAHRDGHRDGGRPGPPAGSGGGTGIVTVTGAQAGIIAIQLEVRVPGPGRPTPGTWNASSD